MKPEIEAKFLNVDHDEVRAKLKKLGAKLEQPMRLMRRTLFDYPDQRFQKNRQRLRVRDEVDRVTVNFKGRGVNQYADEIETTVGSYDTMINLFKATGFEAYSFQESKRETWRYKNVEVVLDEWPWLNLYIEIEGPDEPSIKAVAQELGFSWKDAKFGSTDTAYMEQYPGMKKSDSIGDLQEVKFNEPLPKWLKDRQ